MINSINIPYTIVVPARNEEETIGEVLDGLRGLTDDLIVVDGCSSDNTRAIAKHYNVHLLQDNGRGKGDAIRIGLAKARHPITLFIDADGSHEINDVPKLVGPIARGEADMVIASRMLGGSDELFGSISEVTRLIGSLIISLAINYRFGLRLTDYQNGFRAIRTEVGRAIGLTSNITTIEQEMAMKCLKHNFRIIEIASHESRRRAGISKINVIRVAHLYIWNLLCGLGGPVKSKPETLSPVGESLQSASRQTVLESSFLQPRRDPR